jgi:hypothetical protein
MNAPLPITILFGLVALVTQPMLFGWLEMAQADGTKGLETVRGAECYRFGDEETPAKARRAAVILAQEQAIRSHGVFVKSSSLIKNFQMEEDIIQTASSAMLHDIKIEKEERKPQEVCITLSAKISPVSVEDMIKQRVGAKEIAQSAKATAVPAQPQFGMKVWTNKPDGRFYEGEKLIVYVRSERDAYLKLDYFQADGTVTHLVPNIYRGQAFITGGKTYSFGDETSPEQYVISEPYGTEAIKAIMGVRPFETAADEDKAVGDSRNYLQRLRGIKVVAAASSVELNTESRAVAEYKKESPKR